MSPEVAAFVERIRDRRREGGRPPKITNPAVYSILDGLLAAHREEVSADAKAA